MSALPMPVTVTSRVRVHPHVLMVLYSSYCRGVNLVCTLLRRLLSLLLIGFACFKFISMAPKIVRRVQSTLLSLCADILGACSQDPNEIKIIYLRATGGEVGASSALAPKIGPLGLVRVFPYFLAHVVV
jgi:hypothetical protein